ncbi:hypothetical protein [Nonomuraea salmonea]|uniref:hypothetical protein n=1 Tax=Nonomuraea salmonea TaxID=46181 RepID=UPI003CD0B40F
MSSAASSPAVSSTRSSSSRRHGWAGSRPSISSKARATQSPSSYAPSSRGTGASPASRSEIGASRRWKAAAAGARAVWAALTNACVPSASRTRAATPSEKPPGWSVAPVTRAPSSRSISSTTGAGRAVHGRRCPPVWCGMVTMRSSRSSLSSAIRVRCEG